MPRAIRPCGSTSSGYRSCGDVIFVTDPWVIRRQNRRDIRTKRGRIMPTATPVERETLKTLPSDAARHVQWGFADRYDLQMLLQSARGVARGPVARLVAAGGRNSHEW